MVSLNDIFLAYYDCRRNKRNTASALEFDVTYEERLIELWESINNKTYSPSESIAFIITKPKRREIFAANFRDRVLHHFLDLKLRPLLEKDFVATTCNNRVGKGTEACVKYVERFMYECSNKYTKDCWICKMDMKGFFMSIRKTLLIDGIVNYTNKNYKGDDIDDIIWLLRVILSDDPEKHCIIKSPISEWNKLDIDKSLFTVGDDFGIPIGNLISQLLANFYLNDFDHYVNELGFKYYCRYVDDICIVHENKNFILSSIPLLRAKLLEVGVTLHPHKFYLQHYTKGVKMVGSVIKPNRIYTHNRTVNNAFRSANYLNNMQKTKKNADRVLVIINSYLGFMVNRSNWKIRKKLVCKILDKWYNYFYTYISYNKLSFYKKFKHHGRTTNKRKIHRNPYKQGISCRDGLQRP